MYCLSERNNFHATVARGTECIIFGGMIISKNSQLGLLLEDYSAFTKLCSTHREFLLSSLESNRKLQDKIKSLIGDDGINPEIATMWNDAFDTDITNTSDVKEWGRAWEVQKIVEKHIDRTIFKRPEDIEPKKYLICNGVEECSKMIRIGDTFSSRALKNVSFGHHLYLLGKHETCKFICQVGFIKGCYYNNEKNIYFEFGFDLNENGYFFNTKYAAEFNRILKIMTFVELGDIEVTILEKGRNNGKDKKDGKITNTSNYTVYVVDSSWNKLIIRTEGFAVKGHFRLQPCGVGHADRKLMWIDAFEKHGYKRRPRAEIAYGSSN